MADTTTYDATTGQPLQVQAQLQPPARITSVNIPPPVAFGLIGAVIGFGICWWLLTTRKSMFD